VFNLLKKYANIPGVRTEFILNFNIYTGCFKSASTNFDHVCKSEKWIYFQE